MRLFLHICTGNHRPALHSSAAVARAERQPLVDARVDAPFVRDNALPSHQLFQLLSSREWEFQIFKAGERHSNRKITRPGEDEAAATY